jgi:hypothetical protein
MTGSKEKSMAAEPRHAAWHTDSRFAVKLLAEEGQASDLAADLSDFAAAVDVAVEWLDEVDPAREGDERLAIVETRDGESREVWTYPPSNEPSAGQELVALFGFNPATWRSDGARSFVGERNREPRVLTNALRKSSAAAVRTVVPAPAQSGPPVAPAPVRSRPGREWLQAGKGVGDSVGTAVHRAWADLPSRCCLVAAAASLWLALALTEPLLLVLVLGALGGLWPLRHRRSRAETEDAGELF